MIDPLGPDPNDPAVPARQVGEIVPHLEMPEPPRPTRPRVRYSNYDSPEALKLKSAAIEPEPTRKTRTQQEVAANPVSDPPEHLKPADSTAAPEAKTLPAGSPETALARAPQPQQASSKLNKAVGIAKAVLPIAGRLLPLLEGNIAGAAANLLAGRSAAEVNLKPLEESIARLQADQRAITFHTSEHKHKIQRLQDDLAVLKESLEKNTADQAELIEHVAKLAKRTRSFMRMVTILLVVSILFSMLLVVRIAYLMRP